MICICFLYIKVCLTGTYQYVLGVLYDTGTKPTSGKRGILSVRMPNRHLSTLYQVGAKTGIVNLALHPEPKGEKACCWLSLQYVHY